MTDKDRPRKKDWKREYERGKEPGRYSSDTSTGSFIGVQHMPGASPIGTWGRITVFHG